MQQPVKVVQIICAAVAAISASTLPGLTAEAAQSRIPNQPAIAFEGAFACVALPDGSGYEVVARPGPAMRSEERHNARQTLPACPEARAAALTEIGVSSKKPSSRQTPPIKNTGVKKAAPRTSNVFCLTAKRSDKLADVEASCAPIINRTNSSPASIAEALFRRGRQRYWAQHYEAAIQDLDAGLSLASDHAELHRIRGFAAYESGDNEQAYVSALRATELNPYDSWAFVLMAMCQRDRGLESARWRSIDRVLEIDPSHIWARYERASDALDRRDFQLALADVQRLVRNPQDKFDKRNYFYHYSMKFDEWNASHVLLAKVLMSLSRYAEAETVLNALIAEEPSNAGLHFVRGRNLRHSWDNNGKLPGEKQALEDLRRAVELDPYMHQAWDQISKALLSVDNVKAIDAVERAIAASAFRIGTDFYLPRYLWWRALLEREVGRLDDAKQSALQALQLSAASDTRFAAEKISDLKALGYVLIADLEQLSERALKIAVAACFVDPRCA